MEADFLIFALFVLVVWIIDTSDRVIELKVPWYYCFGVGSLYVLFILFLRLLFILLQLPLTLFLLLQLLLLLILLLPLL